MIFEKIFIPNERLVARKVLDEMMLIPIRGNVADMRKIFAMNPVAEYIWRNLDKSKPLKDIAEGVLENFETDKEVVHQDMEAFITELLKHGLIVEVNG